MVVEKKISLKFVSPSRKSTAKDALSSYFERWRTVAIEMAVFMQQ